MSDHEACWHIVKVQTVLDPHSLWLGPTTFAVTCCRCVHDQQPLKKGSPIADVIAIPAHQPLEE